MTGLVVALVVMYIWAGVTVCCAVRTTMHQKEKNFIYPLIMLGWPVLPVVALKHKLEGL